MPKFRILASFAHLRVKLSRDTFLALDLDLDFWLSLPAVEIATPFSAHAFSAFDI